ncbi:MAG: aspartate--tRNA(Asn) ligase [Candidatus Methanomethylicaceae archaeon]
MTVQVANLAQFVGQEVSVKGWVHTIRRHKNVCFVVIRDSTGLAQVTVDLTEGSQVIDTVSSLTVESTVAITGKVVPNPSVKLNGLEIFPSSIYVYSRAATPLPYDLWGQDVPHIDTRLDYRYLDLRLPKNRLIFEVQTTIEMAMREYWYAHQFIEIHSPKLMGSPSESGSELFKLDYFGKIAYLAQSPQFYKQMAIASGFDKVFEIGPVFRANPSFTARHDTEFTSIDTEIAWIDSHHDIISYEEAWLRHVLSVVSEKHGEQIRQSFGVEVKVPDIPFPKIRYFDAVDMLSKHGYTPNPQSKGDIDPGGERLLSEIIYREYGHEFVFVIDYPYTIRPFYHMKHDEDPSLTKSFDLLWKGLEVTTGAQREHRYEILCKQAEEKGISTSSIQFYLDFFKYGCPPHGGLGFGLTRMMMSLLGLKNVREVTFLYRGPNRLHP